MQQINLVLSTELIMEIGYHKEFKSLTFRAIALHQGSNEGLTLEKSLLNS